MARISGEHMACAACAIRTSTAELCPACRHNSSEINHLRAQVKGAASAYTKLAAEIDHVKKNLRMASHLTDSIRAWANS